MKHNWKKVKLGSVIKYRKSFVSINDFQQYKLCRVQTKAQGVVLRGEKEGIEIKTKEQQICKADDLIFAEMDARFGGYGIIPAELDGAIVSSHYFLYEIDQTVIDKRFLEYCLKQPWFLSQVEAKGSTNYAAIRPYHVLDYEIPLPLLSEQKRVVKKIESIKARIEEIRKLREEQEKELRNLAHSKFIELIEGAEWLEMSEVAPIIRRQVAINPEETYFEIGVRSFGRGLFEKPSFKGSDLTWQKPFWMKEGDLLFSNIKAWEGAVGLIPKKYDGWVGSHRYITCLPNLKIITPEFLYYYFRTFEGIEKLSLASPGTVDRNRTLNNKLLNQITVPVPPLKFQKKFVELLHKTTTIKEYYLKTEKELNELMPALLDKAFRGELFSVDTVAKQKEPYQPKQHTNPTIPAAAANRNEELELAMIVALMESRLGNTYGEVGIQKTVFNLEAFNPVLSKKYNFVNYHFGTYSSELKTKLKANSLLGKKTIKGNDVFSVSPSHKKKVLDAVSNKENRDFVMAINSVLDLYTCPFIGKHTDKIELLNTVTKLIIDLQSTETDAIYQGMQQWEIKQQGFKTKADKFSFSDTSKTIELLKSNGLIQKIIK